MDDPALNPDIDIHVQEILLAASQHDLTKLRHLLRLYSFPECNSVDVEDPETGSTPLHAAIAACGPDDELDANSAVNGGHADSVPNGASTTSSANEQGQQQELEIGAQETVRCLLQHGAIWNQLDKNDETPGCIAYRLKLKALYDLMVDAGVRAELLLNRLEGYEELADSDGDETDKDAGGSVNGQDPPENDSTDQQTSMSGQTDVTTTQYLSSVLSMDASKILDEHSNGVMMSWESGIMASSADSLLTGPGARVLNIGFGMGVIDNHIQSHLNKPTTHHVVEAHPDILADMEAKGWHTKNNVVVHPERWQDILPELVAQGQTFDAIYFDTFAESYSDFRNFFSEQVIGLLDPAGKFSFFNGMGADRQISYDVYQKVVEMDLFEAGFDVEWRHVEVPKLDGEWDGVKRRYWNVEKYRLPVCKYMD